MVYHLNPRPVIVFPIFQVLKCFSNRLILANPTHRVAWKLLVRNVVRNPKEPGVRKPDTMIPFPRLFCLKGGFPPLFHICLFPSFALKVPHHE